MLGGVQVYREPFLLPMENLPVGLGDTSLHSESKGLQRRAETIGTQKVTFVCKSSAIISQPLLAGEWLGYLRGMK